MALSLRVLIGGVTAFIVLVVATITLAITYTVSINAVRDTGGSLAGAIVNTVALDVANYFGSVEDDLIGFVNMSKLPGYMLPIDDPEAKSAADIAVGTWSQKYVLPFRGVMMARDYSYTSLTIIYDDGSASINMIHPMFERYIMEATVLNRIDPVTGNSTWPKTTVYYDLQTKGPWAESYPQIHGVVSDDQRVGGYRTVMSLTGGREKCLYFPPTPDNALRTNPRFILYGLCVVHNRTGHVLGQLTAGRLLEQIDTFLRKTAKTPNTQIFAIDSSRMIVGTTHATRAVTYHQRSERSPVGNCASTLDTTPWAPEFVGCRAYAKDFPYKPLQKMVSAQSSFVYTATRAEQFSVLDGANYYTVSTRIPTKFDGYNLNLVLFMPETDVLGNIVAGRNVAIAVTVCVFIAAAVASFVMVRVLLAPIDAVTKRMYLTSQLTSERELSNLRAQNYKETPQDEDELSLYNQEVEADEPLRASNMAEIRALQTAFNTMDTAIRSFTRYVPRDVVKELMATNQMCEIQMRAMRCSMLFTDIAGFTSICERVAPPILSSLVRLYFERASQIVMGHGGIIDKFIGDCIMAVWGAPVPIDHHELRSAVCARMLTHEVQQDPLKQAFNDAGETLVIRVGVATGEVLAGNMGSQMRMNYTVIGDEVNLASRLEGLNKQWGTHVMVSESTAEECADHLVMRYVISIAVVGKQEPVQVYEVLGVKPDANTEALGAITSEASERQTLNQARQDRDMQEMAERYGVNVDAAPGQQPLSTGKLLRRCLRKCPVTAEEVKFCEVYGGAVVQYNAGDFAGCMATLQGLQDRADVVAGAFKQKSVQKVLAAAEAELKKPKDPSWTGVWVAEEK